MENQNTNIETNQDILSLLEDASFSQETSVIEDQTIQQSDDILLTLEETSPILEETEVAPVTQKKSYLQYIAGQGLFLVKYIATSSLIFLVLVTTTNYSAYVEIAKSYINPEAMEDAKNGMYASIESSTIMKQQEEQKVQESISNEQKLEMIKNKNYHSMEKLNHVRGDDNIAINIEITPYENRIVIPKIGKNIPLIDVEDRTVQNVKELEEVFMKELENGIVRYPGSAKPGNEGNAFIFGHSSNFPWLEWKYNDVFALLDNVVFGDEIIAYYDQKKYVYKVTQKKVIRPGDTSVLEKVEGKKQISLMTCWPVGTTLNRMIVIGELVEVQ